MEFYKVPVQLNEAIREGLIQLWLACAASALGLFLSLYWIVARADRTLREQQARLAETQTLATAVELAGAVAHNQRNPLASIRVSAEMLQDGTSEPAETTEHCQDITSAVDRADRMMSVIVERFDPSQLDSAASSNPAEVALRVDALTRLLVSYAINPPPQPVELVSRTLAALFFPPDPQSPSRGAT